MKRQTEKTNGKIYKEKHQKKNKKTNIQRKIYKK